MIGVVLWGRSAFTSYQTLLEHFWNQDLHLTLALMRAMAPYPASGRNADIVAHAISFNWLKKSEGKI